MTNYRYNATVVRVVDGDTIDVRVDLGFHVSKEIRLRLKGVDTAETYGVPKDSEEYQSGKEHTRFVEQFLASGEEIVVQTYKDAQGKYGRWLADVYVDGESLVEELIEAYPSTENVK